MMCSFIKSSFDALLKLHEVMEPSKLKRRSLTFEQKFPTVKNKLDSVMARLDWLCSEEDDNDVLYNGSEYDCRVELFQWVAKTNPNST